MLEHSPEDSLLAKQEDGTHGRLKDIKVELPLLLVNVGSGVSFIKIDEQWSATRVSGTMVGGGTLMGLARLILETDSFDELLNLASRGSHTHVDLLVSDIYGKGAAPLKNLEGDLIAASLAKCRTKNSPFSSYR